MKFLRQVFLFRNFPHKIQSQTNLVSSPNTAEQDQIYVHNHVLQDVCKDEDEEHSPKVCCSIVAYAFRAETDRQVDQQQRLEDHHLDALQDVVADQDRVHHIVSVASRQRNERQLDWRQDEAGHAKHGQLVLIVYWPHVLFARALLLDKVQAVEVAHRQERPVLQPVLVH